ncbi:prepilin-type N-terminal cleavage/methylation domain-containing protein [Angustibacter sp. Root456]|uniref:type IV pilus modification PilV family protein n=1 Tax=Angustibacter sp. Root456 TaxID=1736539 RepID=UPI0012FB7079|nr:type II secretion system protein [Angustibacter sp. Root456]
MDLRRRWRDRVRGDFDAGFGMVEMLFAMVVFSIIATAVAYGIQSATNSTRLDRNRIQAANLAARELEIVRQEFNDKNIDGPALIGDAGVVTNPHPLASQVAGNPLTIDGLPFTVTRSATWMPSGVGSSACDGGSAVTYPVLAVNVKVSWPRMGSTKPVENNTILTPRKAQVNGTDGYAAVKIVGADGQARSGVPVTVSDGAMSATATTADDGCAVVQFSGLPAAPSSFTATVSVGGWVSNTFNATATGSLSLEQGKMKSTSIAYDQAGALQAQLTTAGGFALPSQTVPITIYSTDIVGGTKAFPGAGPSTTIGSLWPAPAGYVSWPGACRMSDPSSAGTSRQPATVVAPGGTGTISHYLTPVEATVVNSSLLPVQNATIRGYATSTSGCTTDATLTLGVTDSSGRLKTSLPAGTWELRADGLTSSSAWPQLSVNATSPQQVTTLSVTP